MIIMKLGYVCTWSFFGFFWRTRCFVFPVTGTISTDLLSVYIFIQKFPFLKVCHSQYSLFIMIEHLSNYLCLSCHFPLCKIKQKKFFADTVSKVV